MKKFLALVLALIMTFSVVSVAFATEGEVAAPDQETTAPAEGEDGKVSDELDEMLGDYAWILDLPAESLKPAFKIAKIALKFVKVYYKICGVFGIDPADGIAMIMDFIGGLDLGNKEPAPEEATTAPAAAA